MEQEKNNNIDEETTGAANNDTLNSGAEKTMPEDSAARKERLRRRRLERRAKRNARIARGRFFKNIFIWILGILFVPFALAVAVFVVPIGTITGNHNEIVSEQLGQRSVFELVKFASGNPGEISFADFPIIAKSFEDLSNTDIGDGRKIGDIISVDTEKLNTIKFNSTNLSAEIQGCVEVIATLESLGGTTMLGDFGKLSVFTEEEIAGTVAEIMGRTEDAETRKQYYSKSADGKYTRAFDKDGNVVSGLNGGETLYYPPLVKIKISEFVEVFGMAFGRTKVSSVLDVFDASNDTLINILGVETTVKDLATFDINGVKLNTILEGVDVSSNNVLTALKSKNVSIGGIGDALNNLSLYDVYGSKAFTTTPISGARRFNKTTYDGRICFEYSATGSYYLDTKAGIWLILCFDTATYNADDTVNERFADANGNPVKYIADELTIGDLQDGRVFSRKFQNATLKQLIETKVLNGNALDGGTLGPKTQAMSLQDILQILASPEVQYYINNH